MVEIKSLVGNVMLQELFGEHETRRISRRYLWEILEKEMGEATCKIDYLILQMALLGVYALILEYTPERKLKLIVSFNPKLAWRKEGELIVSNDRICNAIKKLIFWYLI